MLTDGLVSYWKFDEGTGSTVGDSVGGNTGTWNGTLGSQWTSGFFNSAGNFNGSDNYVDCGTKSNLQVSTFSFACWIYADGTSSRAIIAGANGAGGMPEFRLNTGNTLSLLKCNVANIGTSTGTVALNQWQHVAATYNSSTGAYAIYINGLLSGSGTNVQSFVFGNFLVGLRRLSGVNSEQFKGRIDELGVWNRVLLATEISVLYNSGNGLQFPFQNTASGTLFIPIQSLQTTFNTTSQGVISNINGRDILLRSTADCYVDFNQPVAPTTSFLLSGSNTEDTEIQVPNGTINNLYFQGATQAGNLYVVVKY